MDILIQNTGETPLFTPLTNSKNNTTGIYKTVTISADNQITKVPEEIYESKMRNNPFWKEKIENGTLIILNDVGTKPQDAVENAAASRELGYSRYKNLVMHIKQNGGADNKELSSYLDSSGMPLLNLVRANMGHIEPLKIEEYRNRYLAEENDGINSLTLPNKRASINPVTTIEKVMEEAEVSDTQIKTETGIQYSKEELEGMDKEILQQIATENSIPYSDRTSSERLINKILDFQNK